MRQEPISSLFRWWCSVSCLVKPITCHSAHFRSYNSQFYGIVTSGNLLMLRHALIVSRGKAFLMILQFFLIQITFFLVRVLVWYFFNFLGCSLGIYPCSYPCPAVGNSGNFTQNATGLGPNIVNAQSTQAQKLGYIYDLLHGNSFVNALQNAFPNSTVLFAPIFNSNGTLIGIQDLAAWCDLLGIAINTTNCESFPQIALFITEYLAYFAPPLNNFEFLLQGCVTTDSMKLFSFAVDTLAYF